MRLFDPTKPDEIGGDKALNELPDKDMKDIITTGQVTDKHAEHTELDGVELPLSEYSDKSSFEPYSGIVLDPEDNMFKTVSGMFRDKKDFYEKLTDRGYVVRKVFEKKVFDWIERNAKNNIEAYLMFSTAFSKWKGNNLLNSYYTKLLNDIPQLNREKIKGDPNSIGDNQKEESVLDEDHEKVFISGYENRPAYDVTVVPVFSTAEGTKHIAENDPNWPVFTIKDVKFNNYPGCTITDYLTSDPEFIRTLYQQTDDRNPKATFRKNKFDKDSGIQYPNYFIFKIGNKYLRHNIYDRTVGNNNGGIVTFDDNFPIYMLKRNTIDVWNSISQNRAQLDANQQNIQSFIGANAEDKANELIFSDMGNLDAVAQAQEIMDTDVADAKTAFRNAQKHDKYGLMKSTGWENRVSQEDRNIIDMFDKHISLLSTAKADDPKVQALLVAYGEDEKKPLNQLTAIHKIKRLKQEFLQKVEVFETQSAKLDTAIDAIKVQLENIYSTAGHSTQDAVSTKLSLENKLKSLEKAKSILEKQKKRELANLGKTAPHIGNISLGGYKSKLNTSKDQMNVGKGIHSKTESTWKSLVNSLKEGEDCFNDGIPRVDDIKPGKHVNDHAGYTEYPTNGVITSPGAFKTGGTFMMEQDEHWGWVHDELNQELFDGTRLRPEVREALLEIAKKFESTLGIHLEPVDVYFTGSSANFNYNDTSDLDLHVVYDFDRIGINAEILVKYFVAKKQVFNNDYSIEIKGIPVEVGVENLNEPVVSSAVYSVTQDKWLIEPEYAEQLLPRPDMKQYYDIVQKIEDVIETRDSTKIGKLWDELYDIRKESLKTEGEYGKGNALFKKLRSLGYLDRLKKAYYSSASEELSLEALKEI